MRAEFHGQCLCGGVRVAVAGQHDPRPGACHCALCRRWTGGVFLSFEAAPEAVSVTGAVKRYASSGFAERAFCQSCGTHLWMRDTDRPGAAYDLMPGLFEASADWPLRSEIYVDEALASVALNGSHPRTTRAGYEAKNQSVGGNTQ